MLVDLDELAGAHRRAPGLVGAPPRPVWFRRTDYLDGTDRPWREVLADLVDAAPGPACPSGPCGSSPSLRTLGWLFNPHQHLLPLRARRPHARRGRARGHQHALARAPLVRARRGAGDGRGEAYPKAFHVSPFLGLDLTYRRGSPCPASALPCASSSTGPTARAVRSGCSTPTSPLRGLPTPPSTTSAGSLRRATQTLRVSPLIYTHALRLWAKGATFHPHPDAVALATGSPTPWAADRGPSRGAPHDRPAHRRADRGPRSRRARLPTRRGGRAVPAGRRPVPAARPPAGRHPAPHARRAGRPGGHRLVAVRRRGRRGDRWWRTA